MTKETKIGLLVGLAFIILFAIILSEKGATRGTKSPSSLTAADAAAKTKPDNVGGAQRPLHDAGRLPVDSQLPSAATGGSVATDSLKPAGKPGGPLSPDTLARAGTLPPAVVEVLNEGADDEEPEARPKAPGAEPTFSVESAVKAALAGDAVSARGPEPLAKKEPAEHARSDAASVQAKSEHGGAEAPDTATAQSDKKSVSAPVAIKTIHEVQPGESLGKIAAKYYGRSTPERVEAIYSANRDVLKSPQVVRASDKLKIPTLEGHESKFEPATEFAPAGMIGPSPKPRDGQTRIPRDVSEKLEGEAPRRSAPRPADTKTAEASPLRPESSPKPDSAGGKKNSESAKPAFVWYEVRKSDTLAGIAKRTLGSDKRYREIQRMNSDIIQDINRLKPGMKIRVPVKGAAEGTATASAG